MRYQIRHALVQYGADTIIEDVNFEIRDREKIAVVGRNGCGKTTLLKLISGEIEMSNLDSDEKSGIFMQGKQRIGLQKQISFPDGSISARDEICKVFADLYAVQARMNEIETLLAAGKEEDDVRQRLLNEYASLQRRYDALSGDSSEREMEIMFQKFGFALEELDRPIGSFSGGQQTKIAFIKLLLSYPDILLLDEPTNHLDLPSIEWLEDYLKKYKNAVVIVSHDRAFLDRIVDVTYEIEYHRMKRYAGNYSAFVKQKEEALAKQEKDYEAQQAEIKRLSEWIEKWKNTPTKVSATRSKRKVIEHMELIEKPRRFDTDTFRAYFSPYRTSYSEVLNVKKLGIGYDHLLSEVSFRLQKGERLAVIGENGMGKSTLLKTLVGLIPPLSGSFTVGENVDAGYFDQQKAVINDEDPTQSVLENFQDTYPKLTNLEARSALAAFSFSQEEVETKIGQLSGGERVRLALCKMFYTRPNFLILDEPTNHMDIPGKEALEKMLQSYTGTVLFVSHDRYFIREVATGILDFTNGEVTQYPFGYDEYLREKEKRSTTEEVSKTPAAADTAASVSSAEIKNPGKFRARIERKIEKIQGQIAESEEKTRILQEQLADPALASDFEKLMEIQAEIDQNEKQQEDLLNLLVETEEELTTL
ncbi:MAG: ABC-F family ATP-binding cassette domain-containing protein [Lachnospiraceae bacterium]|nr:ABC-F family ATP-binding cassette domain-containing protein [Lachnospiraceae bacterium]MBR7076563.1 ABC-F family ATP-binding cassette domain-containing protein [Lachnospiraceae bacterium]